MGGVAGGATAAARARRLDEDAEIIVFERGVFVSFANCGLPYHIGGEIERRAALVLQTPERLTARYRLDIRTQQEVIAIDVDRHTVRARDLHDGREYEESYTHLLLSPGAEPVRPPIPGVDHPRILTLRNIPDVDRIKGIVDGDVKSALVVGGGFIGLEMSENLRRRSMGVTLVEFLPQIMPPLDSEMAVLIERELKRNAVRLNLADSVEAFEDVKGCVGVRLRSGTQLEVDLVILAAGVRPESNLARDAGLELSERGAIVVDEHMRTSVADVYAVGDAVQVRDAVLDQPAYVPLAGPANRQARIAIDHICGRDSQFRGVQGTSVVRVFDLTCATTGVSERALTAVDRPFQKIYIEGASHVGYFPGAERLSMKLLFTPDDGRILGAQIVGGAGVDKRIDVLSVAIQAGLTVYDLEELELAYAPQYGAAKDPLNMAGFVAANVLRGDNEMVYAEALGPDDLTKWTVLDVRSPAEHAADHLPGSLLIPLPELRERWQEIPRNKPIAVYCAVGQRSYFACRLLRQKGLPCKNLAGGLTVYRRVHGKGRAAERCAATSG